MNILINITVLVHITTHIVLISYANFSTCPKTNFSCLRSPMLASCCTCYFPYIFPFRLIFSNCFILRVASAVGCIVVIIPTKKTILAWNPSAVCFKSECYWNKCRISDLERSLWLILWPLLIWRSLEWLPSTSINQFLGHANISFISSLSEYSQIESILFLSRICSFLL